MSTAGHSTGWRGPVTDQEVSGLHAAAFGHAEELVHRTIEECRTSSVDWLHVDFEADLGPFTMTEGLFRRSSAGIMKV